MSSERTPTALTALEPEYWILGEIGRGGTAIVYLARDRATGEEVAIKLIRPKYVEDEEAVARFAREARFVTQLNHPNVVGVHRVMDLGAGGIALVNSVGNLGGFVGPYVIGIIKDRTHSNLLALLFLGAALLGMGLLVLAVRPRDEPSPAP